MRQVLLCIAMCLLATSISGMPQGLDRPVTMDPTELLTNRLKLQAYFCQVLNMTCNNTSESPRPHPDQPQPDQIQSDQPQPDQTQLQVQPDKATDEKPSQTCQCVLRFKCDRRTSNKSTVTTSLARKNSGECGHYLKVMCCYEENIIETEPTEPSVTDQRFEIEGAATL